MWQPRLFQEALTILKVKNAVVFSSPSPKKLILFELNIDKSYAMSEINASFVNECDEAQWSMYNKAHVGKDQLRVMF